MRYVTYVGNEDLISIAQREKMRRVLTAATNRRDLGKASLRIDRERADLSIFVLEGGVEDGLVGGVRRKPRG